MNGSADTASRQPGPDSLAEVFERQIKLFVFAGHEAATSPRLVLVGAQPGAGKSSAIDQIKREGPQNADPVTLTGDVLRPFHPDYATLLCTDPLGMPNTTGPAVAAWVRMCIDHALAERISLLLEGRRHVP